jgi:hypothetical protein
MPTQVETTDKDADVRYKTVEEVQQALRDRGQAFKRSSHERPPKKWSDLRYVF